MIVNLIIIILLIIASISDLKRKRISNILLIGFGIGIIPIFLWRCHTGDFVEAQSVLWGIVPGLLCLLLGKVTKESIGYGDGYLISIIGMYIGLRRTVGLVLIAVFLIGMFAVGMLLLRKANGKSEVPFVPALLMAYGLQSFLTR